MIRFKVYDQKGQPLAACKTLKAAEKAKNEYFKRTGCHAYIVNISK